MERLTNFDGTLFDMDKTLVNAISLLIPLRWSLLVRLFDISVTFDPLSSKAAARTQVSPLLANT